MLGITMDESTYYQFRGQLLILEQIKNPSPWITEAVKKIREELNIFEKSNISRQEVSTAKSEIDNIISKYPALEITYQIKHKQISSPITAVTISYKKPELDFN